MLGLDTENSASPGSSDILVLIEIGSEVFNIELELSLIFLSDISDSDDCGLFLVDKASESFFVLDETVWDVLFSAELGQPEHELNGVDVVGNDDQLGLLVFDQSGHVVQTELEHLGLLVLLLGLLVHFLLGLLQKTGLLLLLGLRGVLLQQLEQSLRLVTVHRRVELVQSWWHLKVNFFR